MALRPALRRAAALAATAIATAGLLALSPTTAGAGAADSDTLVLVPYQGQTFTIWRNGTKSQPAIFTTSEVIEGNFSGAAGTDVFLYNPGSAPDAILHVTPNGTGFVPSTRNESISGTYTPVVGDFDGNFVDDIFWYAPGSAPDSIWLFQADGSHTTKAASITGTYRPTAIDTNGDVIDDIVWYAPGTAPDSIWRFDSAANHTTKAITINGDYQLIPGRFSVQDETQPQRRLVFWSKAGPDSMWEFDVNGNHWSTALPNVDGAAIPVVGSFTDVLQSIYFYRPGSAKEQQLTFFSNGSSQLVASPPQVSGTYDPEVGDYDGNGYEDIAWAANGAFTIWKFNGTPTFTQQAVTTNTVNTFPATIRS